MVEALDAGPSIQEARRARPEGGSIAERLLGIVQIGSSFEREPHALLDRERHVRRGCGKDGREGDAERGSDAGPDQLFLRKTDGMGLEGGSLATFHHGVNILVYSRRCSRIV